MKICSRFLAFLFVVALVGCSKNVDDISKDDGGVVLDPNSRYIHFYSEVSSRGALVEGTSLTDDFAVLGYQYRGDWETESVMARPNVFYKSDVKSESNLALPQMVTYNEGMGIFEYTPIQAWTGNKYSFFGYYPSSHTNIKLFGDGNVKSGSPYINFTLPADADSRKLIDVMTAAYVDTGVSSSPSVNLNFRHRLAAIDVGARNYYDYDLDGNPSTVNDVVPVTIEITKLTVTLENIVNSGANIYLDDQIPTEYIKSSPVLNKSYPMVGTVSWTEPTFDVIPNTKEDRSMRIISTQSGENASSLLLIPQTELLHGTMELTYKKKRKANPSDTEWLYQKANGDWVYREAGDLENDFLYSPDLNVNFSKELGEGRRYYIELTFTSDAVSVNIIAADEWNTLPDVKHEFE